MFKLLPPRPGDKTLVIEGPPAVEDGFPFYLEIDFDDVPHDSVRKMASEIAECLEKYFPRDQETKAFVIAVGTEEIGGEDLQRVINATLKAHKSQVLSANLHVAKGWVWLTLLSKGPV